MGGGRIVTYGSSMGGFEAVNLAGVLEAAYTLAISPISTIFPPFAEVVQDRRYALDATLLQNQNDFIGSATLLTQRGLVFFDWRRMPPGLPA